MGSGDITRTVFLDSGEQRLELQKYQLKVVQGPDMGVSKVFETRRLQIGSSPDNDMILEDPAVSRFHVEIEVSGAGYLLKEDRKSVV